MKRKMRISKYIIVMVIMMLVLNNTNYVYAKTNRIYNISFTIDLPKVGESVNKQRVYNEGIGEYVDSHDKSPTVKIGSSEEFHYFFGYYVTSIPSTRRIADTNNFYGTFETGKDYYICMVIVGDTDFGDENNLNISIDGAIDYVIGDNLDNPDDQLLLFVRFRLGESKQEEKKQEISNYSSEWINGKWYNADGTSTYSGTLSWKSNSIGWWVEDTAGWYPKNQWQKIDGVWYFFKPDGYMASEEYYNGYWFNKNGSWDSKYKLSWKCNATGWWVEDVSGWWPSNKWLKIDGDWYYFNSSGYMVTNQYVGGWWIGADGVCR